MVVFATTSKRRFVHKLRPDKKNTACGAYPGYYTHVPEVISREEAERLHVCRSCFPERRLPTT